MDKLTIVCNELLFQAINAEDYDRIEELAKFSTRYQISLDKRVVDAAKSTSLLCLELLFTHAYNAVPTFIEYMSPEDKGDIYSIMLRRYDANVDIIVYNAVTRECYNVIDMLVYSAGYTNRYKIFEVAFSLNKTNTIKYLWENYIRGNDLYILFESSYWNLKFGIVKYCINDNEGGEYRNSFLILISKSLLYRILYINVHSYSVGECINLLLNRGADINVLLECFPDNMLLILYKMGVSYFGKFTRRLSILLIEEYERREEIRETVSELPDELTNLITEY